MGKFISKYRYLFIAGVAIFFIAIAAVAVGSTAPSGFPVSADVTIAQGMTLNQAADILKQDGIIRSTLLYRAYTVLLGGKTSVKSGDYLFDQPQSALRVAYRLANGVEGFAAIKVTIPEDLASSDIARLIVRYIPGFDGKTFAALAKPQEGYLYPDTYFFTEKTTPQQAVAAMRQNFDQRIKTLTIPPAFADKKWSDVMIMASLVGKEAPSTTDRCIIAGILWKRLASGMPLQVDTPFFYIFGRTSAQVTVTDLATTSPYNTYKHTGLPPTPVDNPDLDAISDTINPVDTSYWFFLAGNDGKIYYASDLAGHIANRQKHLN